MSIKKTIDGDYCLDDNQPAPASTLQQQLLENEIAVRQRNESIRNDIRFTAYNYRRESAGLPKLSMDDHFTRKHGASNAAERQRPARGNNIIPIKQPKNRDDITLLTR